MQRELRKKAGKEKWEVIEPETDVELYEQIPSIWRLTVSVMLPLSLRRVQGKTRLSVSTRAFLPSSWRRTKNSKPVRTKSTAILVASRRILSEQWSLRANRRMRGSRYSSDHLRSSLCHERMVQQSLLRRDSGTRRCYARYPSR